MTAAGAKIIEGLKDAVAGNFAAVTIEGQRWVRAPEWQLIESAPLPPFDEKLWFINEYRCLGATVHNFIGEISYSYTKTGKGRWRNSYGVSCAPTHWMPSPEPPVSA